MDNAQNLIAKRTGWIATIDWIVAVACILSSAYFVMAGDFTTALWLALGAVISAAAAYTKLAERIAKALLMKIVSKRMLAPQKSNHKGN